MSILTPRINKIENKIGSNLIINGAFDFWQRGTALTNAGAGALYLADRWCFFTNSSSPTPSLNLSRQISDVPGFSYFARLTRNNGNTNASGGFLIQGIESANIVPYQGRTMTASFYARAGAGYTPSGGILVATLQTGTGVDESPAGNYTGATNFSTNAVLTTSWQRFEITFDMPADASEAKILFRANHVGTAGANDYFDVRGVMLHEGAPAGDFKRAGKTIGEELALCQRYYEKSYILETNPGTVTTVGLEEGVDRANSAILGTGLLVSYKVYKRASATVTVYNSSTGAAGTWIVNGATRNFSVNRSHSRGFAIRVDDAAAALTAGSVIGYVGHWTADSEL